MSPLTWQRLTVVGLVSLALTWLLVRMVDTSGTTPPVVPWSAWLVSLVAAACVLWFAWQVRQFLKGKRPDLSPLRAVRTAIFAQAAGYVGAVLVGGYGGYALGLLDAWSHGPRREVIISALIAAAAAAVLMIAGWIGELWCRHSDDDEDRSETSPA
ncbi:DUF3180 domain-containing protein [Demequina flava]|uniref:DUF3180 domain-containing protein n=1 Tax=Demequina flava TaxID=1095025 RepID=UPI000785A98D|nr:DUF3180 domain-containing protein [Demequina flava]